jgi:hypothetical protein
MATLVKGAIVRTGGVIGPVDRKAHEITVDMATSTPADVVSDL